MFKIYWSDAANQAHAYDTPSLTEALTLAQAKRSEGQRFVTMVSENPNSVGKAGVDTVANRKLPDGTDYDWSKADRAGKPRKHDCIALKEDRL